MPGVQLAAAREWIGYAGLAGVPIDAEQLDAIREREAREHRGWLPDRAYTELDG